MNEKTKVINNLVNSYTKRPFTNLELRNINIENIPHIFSTFTELKTLTLENCNLKSLDNLPSSIEILDVSRNEITQIDDIERFKNLNTLNISNNPITKINLGNMKHIRCLLINDTNLDYIIYPPNLLHLDKNNCKIKSTNTSDDNDLLDIHSETPNKRANRFNNLRLFGDHKNTIASIFSDDQNNSESFDNHTNNSNNSRLYNRQIENNTHEVFNIDLKAIHDLFGQNSNTPIQNNQNQNQNNQFQHRIPREFYQSKDKNKKVRHNFILEL